MSDGDEDIDLRPLSPFDTLRRWWGPPRTYQLTRWLILRLLGVLYLSAFLGLVRQGLPLLGSHGLTPIASYLSAARVVGVGFWKLPSLFWIDASDGTLQLAAYAGVALSAVVVLGFANLPILFALWVLYSSFVHLGQDWFSFGWEIQLLETGFLCAFLAPPLDPRPLPARRPPRVVIVLLLWVVFRLMLGAGLIKMRGDPCWRELTCLDWHFETQPIPNPLSPGFHFLPHPVHAFGVLYNHLCELILPWFLLAPRRLRLISGALLFGFQGTLILSGNLAFLNWLTLVPILACFDDDFLRWLLPRRARAWLDQRPPAEAPGLGHRIAAGALATLIAVLSLEPIGNLLSSHQAMNRSFDRFALVNTYGAFGSVGEQRDELIIEGTRDAVVGDATAWQAYELPCKPGDPMRRPCVLGPYHYRLDWLMWFAAMGTPDQYPWAVHLIAKLLEGDPSVRPLLARDPFPDAPPRFIRVERYRYRFARYGEEAWWKRERIGEWLEPIAADDPRLDAFLRAYGWR